VPAVRAVRALPWARLLAYGRIVLDRFSEDIPKKDRTRLGALLKASKGDPRNLTAAQRAEFVAILRRIDVGRLSKDLAGTAALARTARLLKR
jgi:hypothetical protein